MIILYRFRVEVESKNYCSKLFEKVVQQQKMIGGVNHFYYPNLST